MNLSLIHPWLQISSLFGEGYLVILLGQTSSVKRRRFAVACPFSLSKWPGILTQWLFSACCLFLQVLENYSVQMWFCVVRLGVPYKNGLNGAI